MGEVNLTRLSLHASTCTALPEVTATCITIAARTAQGTTKNTLRPPGQRPRLRHGEYYFGFTPQGINLASAAAHYTCHTLVDL